MVSRVCYVEVDVPYCALVYGNSPCTATLTGPDPTGTIKCFNTPATCQDRENYDETIVTLRFSEDSEHYPKDIIDAIPAIENVSFTPAVISLGENLGQRATLAVTFRDLRHSDTGPGFDKYLADRAYDPFRTGTFWGKFRARQPFLRGRKIRLIRGDLGQALIDMETRHFIIESTEGLSPQGTFTIIAKDVLKMADGDRAQAPRLSQGFIVADINSSVTAATLSPTGIGNSEYPDSGLVAIGGTEICSFTRLGDALTLTRGQQGTVAAAHKAQDRVQLCLQYTSEDPADIISDLFQTYAEMPADYIPLAAWQTETSAFLRRVYTAVIPEPTSVNTLVSELVQQCGLAVFWDENAELVRLQVLRQISTDAAVFDRDNTISESYKMQEQPEKRISRIQTYFGQINPLKKVDDPDNYRSSCLTVDTEAEADYGTPAIKRIYARWIPALGRTVAERVNDIQLGRFRDAPRRFNLAQFRQQGGIVPVLGQGYQIKAQPLQTATGEEDIVPIQITRLNPGDALYEIEAEEMRFVSFDDGDLSSRVIIAVADTFNINFRSAHDLLYPTPVDGDAVTFIIESGVRVGSTSTGTPAFTVGTWPTRTHNATRSSASPVLTGIPVDTLGLAPGMFVAGTGLQANSKILTVDSSTQITLDKNAVSSGTSSITIDTVILNLIIRGGIHGKGGAGGRGQSAPGATDQQPGQAGGLALYSRRRVNLQLDSGKIWSGGGGGAGARYHGAGGGAGYDGGAGGASGGNGAGQAGSTTSGGAGASGGFAGPQGAGAGGGPGLPGLEAFGSYADGSGYRSPGVAGTAIDGVSYLLITGSGDRRGPEIN